MKIAVLLYFFPSANRVYITSLCDMLLRLGHTVDVFSFFISDGVFKSEKNINKNDQKSNIFSYLSNKFHFIVEKKIKVYFRRFRRFFFPYTKKSDVYWNNYKLRTDMQKINKELRKLSFYDFSIGVEKGGVICAYEFYKYNKTPFYYFSLELYTEDHPSIIQPSMHKAMRNMEIIAHKNAAGTIIADEDRKNYLYKTGNIDNAKPTFYLPISFDNSIANPLPCPTSIIHDINKKIILNFGYNRLPDDLFISFIKKLPEEYLFFMHNVDTDYHEKLSNEHSLNGVLFSHQFLNENEIMSMITDSFVGLCWYEDEVSNDIFIAFSSEKTARYLAAGKPIIANSKTNFTKLFSQYKCGIGVNSPKEFIDALQTISSDYKTYSEQAKEAFEKIYKLSNYQQSLNMFLQSNINEKL